MSEGYRTAAQREALGLICEYDPLHVEGLGEPGAGTRQATPDGRVPIGCRGQAT